MALTPDQKDEFSEAHLPHRLCLLMAFRDRQPWFKERIGQKDCDLLTSGHLAICHPPAYTPSR